jgi:crotonobetainyl-CoA:carnitine CoA-transferase CaiB-like acyl-CoA transferase
MPKAMQAAEPLPDLTVLDLTYILAGLFASMILRDLGAQVINSSR